MSHSPNLIGALVLFEPEEAKKRILKAFKEVGGLTQAAALNLGVTKRTLDRWVSRLEIRRSVERIREKLGRSSRESDGFRKRSHVLLPDGRHPPTRPRRKK